MKIVHVLGHNYIWNIDAYQKNGIGDEFLITAYTFGRNFNDNQRISPLLDNCLIDLQFYGKKFNAGKLSEFSFHPCLVDSDEVTNLYSSRCIIEAIEYQIQNGFKRVIIPILYEKNDHRELLGTCKVINNYLKRSKIDGVKYYMTIPFSNNIIQNSEVVDEILSELTDQKIIFDGYFITCECKPEQGHKITNDIDLISNLSNVFKTFKHQGFETIYAYANWDSIIYLAQTDIDYITIGTYENLRNFSIKRFTEKATGGPSLGFYFSEKILNLVGANDISLLRKYKALSLIENEHNIFSKYILADNFIWSNNKPDVNKNYLLSVSKLLNAIASIKDVRDRTLFVLNEIQKAIIVYEKIDKRYIELGNSVSRNYHLSVWKQILLKSISMKPSDFNSMYE